MVVISS